MPQRKINSFFNHRSSEIVNPVSNFQTNINPSATMSMHWNAPNYHQASAYQRYHNGRKKQKNLQANEHVLFQNKLMTPSNSQLNQHSQVSDDSQKFPNSSQSQSQETTVRNQTALRPVGSSFYLSQNKFASSGHLANVGAEYNSVEADVKKEFNSRWHAHLQAEKEQEEREMLHHFLVSAKQCCEEANAIAERVTNNIDSFSSNVIMKMKECLETIVPKLLQKITDNNDEKEVAFQIKLTEIENEVKKRDEQIATMEQKLLESIENKGDHCTKEIVETINLTNQNSQKTIEELIWEIRMNFNKPKPLLCEMASQYSPQLQINAYPCTDQAVHSSNKVENRLVHNANKQRVVQTHKYPASKVTFPFQAPTSPHKLCTGKFKRLSRSPLGMRENDSYMYKSPTVAMYPRKSLRSPIPPKTPVSEKLKQPRASDVEWFDQENAESQIPKFGKKRQTRKRKKQATASSTTASNAQRKIKSGSSGSANFASKKEVQSKTWNIFDDSDVQDTHNKSTESIDDDTILHKGNNNYRYQLSWLTGRSSDSEESDFTYSFRPTSNDRISLQKK